METGAHSENMNYLKWNRIFILVKFVVILSIPNITFSLIEKMVIKLGFIFVQNTMIFL